jgi:hypothetical protein
MMIIAMMKKAMLLVITLAALAGCSVLMPYEENFACQVPSGVGVCGSITDVYKETTR